MSLPSNLTTDGHNHDPTVVTERERITALNYQIRATAWHPLQTPTRHKANTDWQAAGQALSRW